LTSSTAGATIYFTTDGTIPTSASQAYKGPFSINRDTVINAIAVKYGYIVSDLATYSYKFVSKNSFKDISAYPGLTDSLDTLIQAGVISDGNKFYPSEGFTYDDLIIMLEDLDVVLSRYLAAELEIFDTDEDLTYNEFVYITYLALREADLINPPRKGTDKTLKQLTNWQLIESAALTQAGFASFVENVMFYTLDFNPTKTAPRAYLATALARVIVINK
jgi:hypothetical protein